MNLKSSELETWSFLTQPQRKELMECIKSYLEHHDLKVENINYSPSMSRLMFNKKLNQAMKKMKKRRITQNRLLLLSKNAINQFSFLEEEEKRELPGAISEYKNGKDFKELAGDIEREVKGGVT